MKAYANLYHIFEFPAKDLEYEVLNELRDLTSRSDANCLYHTRFVFECDDTDLDKQYDWAYSLRADEMAVRATYSGGKSVHVILEFEPELEEICKKYYKEIWAACNQLLFNGEADKACANPARLTRRPGAVRANNGKAQTLLYDMPEHIITKASYPWRRIWRMARTYLARKATANASAKSPSNKSQHDGLCADYEPVKYYMNKNFPRLKGNGDSASSLFKAIRCCIKYGDAATLQMVIVKAKAEHWTDKEIAHILQNIDRYI